MERVGRRDDFFELGGHSLLAVQRDLARAAGAGRGGGARRALRAARCWRTSRAGWRRPRAPELPPIEPVDARRAAAALLRAAAALVPGAAGSLGSTLPHPRARCGCAGELDRGGAGARAGRGSSRGTRRCAPPSREVDGEPGAARSRRSEASRSTCVEHDLRRRRRTREAELRRLMARGGARAVRPGARARSSAAGWCGWRRTTTCCC